MACACQKKTTSAQSYTFRSADGTVTASYSSKVEGEAAVRRLGGTLTPNRAS